MASEKITPRSQDFSKWYQDVILKARLADYSPVKGCMVIRPNGYVIWERIQKELDYRIQKTGARNAYFPLFIPESFLKKEAEHIEGFAPQCAVVAYAGAKELNERLVVRPTSETIINSMFSKWIHSYRDLPLMINQWANVVRWEMRTRLFLRTSEFLWQEGHTCHATAEQAEVEARLMIELYRNFLENFLAIPVIAGQKTESEKFAGASRTYCIEAMMQDKKALQAGTSHYLSDHFSRAFETSFLDQDGQQKFVYQTSWGVSTRLIGGVVMTHSDDHGLVLPPTLAYPHIVIVPVLSENFESKTKIINVAKELSLAIEKMSNENKILFSNAITVHLDLDETKKAGWKFYEYELLGVPVRIEIGSRELEESSVLVFRRDSLTKEKVSLDQVPAYVLSLLEEIQKNLFIKAKIFQEQNTFRVEQYSDLTSKLNDSGGFMLGPWCQSLACEAQFKEKTKATIRCLSLDSQGQLILDKGFCVICRKKEGQSVQAVFAKSY